MILKEFQRYCLQAQVAFVSYASPGTGAPVTLFAKSSDVKTYDNIREIDIKEGFVLSPFQSERIPVVVIPQHNRVEGWEVQDRQIPTAGDSSYVGYFQNSMPDSISFQQYAKQIEIVKRSIAAGETKKVVLSRTKLISGLNATDMPEIFEELVKRYEHAFVYLIHTSHSGTWIGATPETILEIDKRTFFTMALAGTKSFPGDTHMDWDDKELHEHAFVVDDIRQKLNKGGYSFAMSDRETVRAGNLVHLRTTFRGSLANHNETWKNMVSVLYPTPAIFGTGSTATLRLIQDLEGHKREYYTGIIGPFANNKSHLFINLRCMKAFNDSALLFAGGGIVSESSAVREWDETELKFNTLIQVIRKVEEKKKLAKEHATKHG